MAKARKTRSKGASTKGASKRASKTDFKFGANKGDKNAGRRKTGSIGKSTAKSGDRTRRNKQPDSKATNKTSSKRSNKNADKTSNQKTSKEKTLKKRFVVSRATRKEKFNYAKKIGKEKYYKLLRSWWDRAEDLALQPDDNPYLYHSGK